MTLATKSKFLIHAPIEEVFELCTDFGRWATFIGGISAVNISGASKAKFGSRVTIKRVFAGQNYTQGIDITEFDAPKKFKIFVRLGVTVSAIHWEFEVSGESTKVMVSIEPPLRSRALLGYDVSVFSLHPIKVILTSDLQALKIKAEYHAAQRKLLAAG